MTHLFNHQPLLTILTEVLDYSDLVKLSQIEKRFISALKIRQQKLKVIQSWSERTFEKSSIKKIILEQLTNLRELNLHRNGINEIPPEIGQLTNLEYLILGMNEIREIPPAIGKLTNLKMLDLMGNGISEIPPEIGQLINLEYLDLSWNRISEIPPEIGQLTNLLVLDLNSNRISKIPPEIGQLTNLQVLSFWSNQIEKIPPEIGHLTNLKMLDLYGNRIIEIPPDLFFKATWGSGKEAFEKSLTRLRPETPVVLREALAKKEIRQLTNLKTLNLRGNRITEIPPALKTSKLQIYI